ncbi:MAG: hypothetical protein GY850_27405 [bacterium]|nr:hypothetical protein [bacterium]
MKQQADTLIVGARLSGCAGRPEAANSRGQTICSIGKNIEPGGLTRSISLGDAHFDHTGHFLHLAKWKSPAAPPTPVKTTRYRSTSLVFWSYILNVMLLSVPARESRTPSHSL